jgi:hypothetical protein
MFERQLKNKILGILKKQRPKFNIATDPDFGGQIIENSEGSVKIPVISTAIVNTTTNFI